MPQTFIRLYACPHRLPISWAILWASSARASASRSYPARRATEAELARFSLSIGRLPSSRHSARASSRFARDAPKPPIAIYGRHRSLSVKAICSRAFSSRAMASDRSPASTASRTSPPPYTFRIIRFHKALDSATLCIELRGGRREHGGDGHIATENLGAVAPGLGEGAPRLVVGNRLVVT